MTDKRFCVLMAIVLVSLYLTKMINGTLAIVFLGVAIVYLLTRFISFCPLYLPFGITTIERK